MKIAESSNLLFDGQNRPYVNTESTTLGPSDLSAWVIFRSDNIVIKNTSVSNYGDSVTLLASEQAEYCVRSVLIPILIRFIDATNVLVTDLVHFGGGITIGPLGKLPGQVDKVENITITYDHFLYPCRILRL